MWLNLLVLLGVIIFFLIVPELVFRIFFSKQTAFHMDLNQFLESQNLTLTQRLSNYSIFRNQSVFRIAIIGDSFMLGVSTEKNISLEDSAVPLLLQKKLDDAFGVAKYEVLNFGLEGANALDEFFILKEITLKYKPDVVVLAVNGNDWNFHDYNINPFVHCAADGIFSENLFNFLSTRSKLFNYFYMRFQNNNNPSFWLARYLSQFNRECLKQSLFRMSAVLSSENITSFAVYIYDIYFPDAPPDRTFKELDRAEEVAFEIQFFHSCFESAGFTYVDTFPLFMNLTAKEVFADDHYHFSRKGNDLIAELVFSYMPENKLLPDCKIINCTKKLIVK